MMKYYQLAAIPAAYYLVLPFLMPEMDKSGQGFIIGVPAALATAILYSRNM